MKTTCIPFHSLLFLALPESILVLTQGQACSKYSIFPSATTTRMFCIHSGIPTLQSLLPLCSTDHRLNHACRGRERGVDGGLTSTASIQLRALMRQAVARDPAPPTSQFRFLPRNLRNSPTPVKSKSKPYTLPLFCGFVHVPVRAPLQCGGRTGQMRGLTVRQSTHSRTSA